MAQSASIGSCVAVDTGRYPKWDSSDFGGCIVERYAVNVGDVVRRPDMALAVAITINAVKGEIVKAEKTLDGDAITLNCGAVRARAIIDVLHIKQPSIRCYVQIKKAWRRIPQGKKLTEDLT